MDDFFTPLTIVIAIAAVNMLALTRIVLRRRLVSAIGGLHFSILIYIVIGPAAYLIYEPPAERAPYNQLIEYFITVGVPFLVGYSLWVLLEARLSRGAISSFQVAARIVPSGLVMVVWTIGFMGYFLAQLEIATSGAGTIFIVMKNMLYPSLLIGLCRLRQHDLQSTILALGTLGISIILGATSAWRSDLVVTGVCVVICAIIIVPRLAIPMIAASTVGMWLILPSLQAKKTNFQEYSVSPISAIWNSQDISYDERTDMLATFLAVRVNSLREMAYVARGLDAGLTQSRGGESYINALLHLIPRAIWKSKPSYNLSLNYTLPREIGLVAFTDEGTSWGVNAYAEYLINFPTYSLAIFIPAMFLLFHCFDILSQVIYRSESVQVFAAAVLFFLTFTMVGLVMMGTLMLWGAIFLKLIDYYLVLGHQGRQS
jgi:hypothetical protein